MNSSSNNKYTVVKQNIFHKNLKRAKRAYNLACEYGTCPKPNEEGYVSDLLEYSGKNSSDIISIILTLIDKLQ